MTTAPEPSSICAAITTPRTLQTIASRRAPAGWMMIGLATTRPHSERRVDAGKSWAG